MVWLATAGRRHLFDRDIVNAWAFGYAALRPDAACGQILDSEDGAPPFCVTCVASAPAPTDDSYTAAAKRRGW